jgi:intracellular multiplication protein IcmP
MQANPNPRAAWPSRDDNTGFYLLVILFGACALSYLLWINYHGPISAAVMAFHHIEILLLRHITDRFDLADRQMAAVDPDTVSASDLYGISRDLGSYVRIPAAIVMALLAAICSVRAAPGRFCRSFDLDGLIREQAATFPVTTAFAGRRLRLVAPRNGDPRPADYALTPQEWIRRYATGDDEAFDEAAARRALIRQLGVRWRGVALAGAPVRCLFAAFSLHLAEKRDEAVRLLGIVSASLDSKRQDAPGGPDASLTIPAAAISEADTVLRHEGHVAQAAAIANRHAYTHTALMSLLNACRLQAGVLAPGQFAWLKLVDRSLWYALHSLGFESEGSGRYLHPNPRIEAIGARDHWAYERIAGAPVINPDLDRALDVIRQAAPGPRKPGSQARA